MPCDSAGSIYRRRAGRYSSVRMSSTEMCPLFTTPTSEHGQLPIDCLRSGSSRSTASPLACADITLAKTELDRLASQVEQASEIRSTSSLTRDGPEMAASPLRSSLSAVASIRRSLSRSENTKSSPPLSGSLIGALHLQKNQRRKASSRQSEICTPEGIPEVSDEDLSASDSASTFPSAVECSPSEQYLRDNALVTSDPILVPADSCSTQQDGSTPPDSFIDPIDQAFERACLTQDQLPKVLQSPATTWRAKNPGLRVEFANPLASVSAPEIGHENPKTLGNFNDGLDSCPRIHGLSKHPEYATGRTDIGNLSSSSTPFARAVISETITPEQTRGLWSPPRPRTPAVKRDSMQTHDAISSRKE